MRILGLQLVAFMTYWDWLLEPYEHGIKLIFSVAYKANLRSLKLSCHI